MGTAEVISFEEVRARKQWDALRGQLHTRFDQWLDGLEAQLREPAPTLAQVTETVWNLRQELTGGLTETIVEHAHRPVLVLGIDGAYVPTRPDSARQPCAGHRRKRAKRARWRGQWRDAKGFRFYLLDGERIVHVLSWHQVQNEEQLGEALKEIKKAGVIPEEQVRLCVVCDGAEWIWKHVQALFPQARQVLDYYHCAQYLHRVAKAHYGLSVQALEWVEATMTRLYLGGMGLTRDSVVSVMYAEELNSAKSSVTLQRTDRHGIVGQKPTDFQVSL
jgi:hypothetical protein